MREKIEQTLKEKLQIEKVEVGFERFGQEYFAYKDLTSTYSRKIIEPIVAEVKL